MDWICSPPKTEEKIAWEAPHSFDTWDDFPTSLSRLKQKYLCCSFTILSLELLSTLLEKIRFRGMQFFPVKR